MNALFTLASVAIWIPHILYWRVSEERQLEKRYENYQEYKKRPGFSGGTSAARKYSGGTD